MNNTMIFLDIKECLNHINEAFYDDKIKKYYDISIVLSANDNDVWTVSYPNADNKIIITAGNNFPHIESFTHEMLHIYTYTKGFSRPSIYYFNSFKKLSQNIVDLGTIGGILNNIAHFKMLPIFENVLLFKRNTFYSSWVAQNFTEKQFHEFIELNFQPKNKNWPNSFTNFLRCFFDIRYELSDSPNKEYIGFDKRLQILDNELYEILVKACEIWEADMDNFLNTDFFNSLFTDLEAYLVKKEV